MKQTSMQINFYIWLCIFATCIASLIGYCSTTPKIPTCEEQGGIMKLIGYRKIYGGGDFLYPKFKCEIANDK